MEYSNGVLSVEGFLTFTLALMVLFVGKRVNDALDWLREFSIPEPVTGGLLRSILIVPLVCAFFIDRVNSMLIPSFLSVFGQ